MMWIFLLMVMGTGFCGVISLLRHISVSLRDISETLPHIRFALEDQIKADMDNAEPECARCGAECTNPECVAAVRER